MIKIPNTMAKLYSPIISILLRFYSSFGFLSGSRIGIIDLLKVNNKNKTDLVNEKFDNFNLKIKGSNMLIKHMQEKELIISGNIVGVSYE